MRPGTSGGRHNSWFLSNTTLVAIGFFVLLGATIAADIANGSEPPPTYLTGLLGVAGGALFGAAGSDRSKRDAEVADDARTAKQRVLDVNETAIRAEHKADLGLQVAQQQHPDSLPEVPEPLIPPAGEGEAPPL